MTNPTYTQRQFGTTMSFFDNMEMHYMKSPKEVQNMIKTRAKQNSPFASETYDSTSVAKAVHAFLMDNADLNIPANRQRAEELFAAAVDFLQTNLQPVNANTVERYAKEILAYAKNPEVMNAAQASISEKQTVEPVSSNTDTPGGKPGALPDALRTIGDTLKEYATSKDPYCVEKRILFWIAVVVIVLYVFK